MLTFAQVSIVSIEKLGSFFILFLLILCRQASVIHYLQYGHIEKNPSRKQVSLQYLQGVANHQKKMIRNIERNIRVDLNVRKVPGSISFFKFLLSLLVPLV